MNESMQQLIEMVKNVAPAVWQAAYRQVWIDAGENLFGALLIGSVTLWAINWVRRRWSSWDGFDDGPAKIITPLGICILAGITLGCLITFVDDVANPTFQAIKALGELVHK